MIPLRDTIPSRIVPLVTWCLIAANVVVFLWEATLGAELSSRIAPLAFVPARFFSSAHSAPAGVAQQVAPLFASMFLHGGWLHLIGNMLFLFVFGNNVEDRLGHLHYLLFYIGCGYIATYAFAALNANSTQPLVGASGAIAGVLGAYLWLFPRARVTSLVPFLLFLPLALPAWIVLGTWFVLQWIYFQGMGVAGSTGVAYAAHVAGFIAGFGYAALFVRRPRPEPPRYQPTAPPPGRLPY